MMRERLVPFRNETRREFLVRTAAAMATAVVGGSSLASGRKDDLPPLAGVVGITTGGLNHQRRQGKLTLLALPRFLRDELGMRLIDLNTHWLEGYEPSYLEQVRGTAQEYGCFFTNLKVNHQFGDLYSRDPQERRRALASARRLIKVAKALGTRWIRFVFPSLNELGNPLNPTAHRELAEFAEQYDIQLLVENLGWLARDVNSVTRLVASIGRNVAPCPDIGNWSDDIRYEGLARTFPGAATCDFKAFEMNQNFEHKRYNIERCFHIGWKSGFRGPWAVEHSNEDTSDFIRETVHMRERLQQWIAAAS